MNVNYTARDDRTIVAYHEAGHATMGLLVGFSIASASIVPDAVSRGRVAFHDAVEDPYVHQRHALVCCAGLAGDAAHAMRVGADPEIYFQGYGGDHSTAREVLKLAHPLGPNAINVYLPRAVNQLQREDNWEIVDAIARSLLAKNHLTASEIATFEVAVKPLPTRYYEELAALVCGYEERYGANPHL